MAEDLVFDEEGGFALVSAPEWLPDGNGGMVIKDGHLGLAGSYNPSATGRGNPWHDPRTGQFTFGPPGVNVFRGAELGKGIANQSKWAIQNRWRKTGGDKMAYARAKNNRIFVSVFRGNSLVDQYYVPANSPDTAEQQQTPAGVPPGKGITADEINASFQVPAGQGQPLFVDARDRLQPASFPGAAPEELRRREQAIRQAMLRYGNNFTLDTARDFLKQRTVRPFSTTELVQFHDDVRRAWITEVADAFEERRTPRGKGIEAPKRISDAWLRSEIPKMSRQDVDELFTMLRDRGWDDSELSARVVPFVPTQHQRAGEGLGDPRERPPVPAPELKEYPELTQDFARWLVNADTNVLRNLAGDHIEELMAARDDLPNIADEKQRKDLERHIRTVETGLRNVLREVTKREAQGRNVEDADTRTIADAMEVYGDPDELDPWGGVGKGMMPDEDTRDEHEEFDQGTPEQEETLARLLRENHPEGVSSILRFRVPNGGDWFHMDDGSEKGVSYRIDDDGMHSFTDAGTRISMGYDVEDEQARAWLGTALAMQNPEQLREIQAIIGERRNRAAMERVHRQLRDMGELEPYRIRGIDIANAFEANRYPIGDDSEWGGPGKGIDFPRRITQEFIQTEFPKVTDRSEINDAIDVLNGRGWINEEFEVRVWPNVNPDILDDSKHYYRTGERRGAEKASPTPTPATPPTPGATGDTQVTPDTSPTSTPQVSQQRPTGAIAGQYMEPSEYFGTTDPKKRPRVFGERKRAGEPETIEQMVRSQLYEIRRIEAALSVPSEGQKRALRKEMLALGVELRNARHGAGDRDVEDVIRDLALLREKIRTPAEYPAVASGAVSEADHRRDLEKMLKGLKPAVAEVLGIMQERKMEDKERGDPFDVADGLEHERLKAEALEEMSPAERAKAGRTVNVGGVEMLTGEPTEEELRETRNWESTSVAPITEDELEEILKEETEGKGIARDEGRKGHLARTDAIRAYRDDSLVDRIEIAEDSNIPADDRLHVLFDGFPGEPRGTARHWTPQVTARIEEFKGEGNGGNLITLRPAEAREIGKQLRAGGAITPNDVVSFDTAEAFNNRIASWGGRGLDMGRVADALFQASTEAELRAPDADVLFPATDRGRTAEGPGTAWLNNSIMSFSSAEVLQLKDSLRRGGWAEGDINERIDPHVHPDIRGESLAERRVHQIKLGIAEDKAQKAIRAWAKGLKVDPDMLEKQMLDNLKAVLDDGHLAVRVQHGHVKLILRDGKLKNRHELYDEGTRYTGAGMSAASKHRQMVDDMFRTVEGEPIASGDYPVYGYVGKRGEQDGPSWGDAIDEIIGKGPRMYGDAKLILKPGKRDDATITVGDSINGMAPSPMNDPSIGSFKVYDEPEEVFAGRVTSSTPLDPSELRSHEDFASAVGYIEAQLHGGVSVDDIQEVVFDSRYTVDDDLVAALDEFGIPWSHYGDDRVGATDRVKRLADALDAARLRDSGKGLEVPERVRDKWLHAVLPTLSEAEGRELLGTLQERGWTHAEMDARVRPYLPTSKAAATSAQGLKEGDRVKSPDGSKVGTISRMTSAKIFVMWDGMDQKATPVGYAYTAGLKRADDDAVEQELGFFDPRDMAEAEDNLAEMHGKLEETAGRRLSPSEAENLAAHMTGSAGRIKKRHIGMKYLASLKDLRRMQRDDVMPAERTGREVNAEKLAYAADGMLSRMGMSDHSDDDVLTQFYRDFIPAVGGRPYTGSARAVGEDRLGSMLAMALPNGNILVRHDVVDALRALAERYRNGDSELKKLDNPEHEHEVEVLNFLTHEAVHQMLPPHLRAASMEEYSDDWDKNPQFIEEGLTETLSRELLTDMLDALDLDTDDGRNPNDTEHLRADEVRWVRENFTDFIEESMSDLPQETVDEAVRDELLRVFDLGLLRDRIGGMDEILLGNYGVPITREAFDELPSATSRDELLEKVGGVTIPDRMSSSWIDENADRMTDEQRADTAVRLAGVGNKEKMRKLNAAVAAARTEKLYEKIAGAEGISIQKPIAPSNPWTVVDSLRRTENGGPTHHYAASEREALHIANSIIGGRGKGIGPDEMPDDATPEELEQIEAALNERIFGDMEIPEFADKKRVRETYSKLILAMGTVGNMADEMGWDSFDQSRMIRQMFTKATAGLTDGELELLNKVGNKFIHDDDAPQWMVNMMRVRRDRGTLKEYEPTEKELDELAQEIADTVFDDIFRDPDTGEIIPIPTNWKAVGELLLENPRAIDFIDERIAKGEVPIAGAREAIDRARTLRDLDNELGKGIGAGIPDFIPGPIADFYSLDVSERERFMRLVRQGADMRTIARDMLKDPSLIDKLLKESEKDIGKGIESSSSDYNRLTMKTQQTRRWLENGGFQVDPQAFDPAADARIVLKRLSEVFQNPGGTWKDFVPQSLNKQLIEALEKVDKPKSVEQRELERIERVRTEQRPGLNDPDLPVLQELELDEEHIGGSTGPRLYRHPETEERYVVKRGASEGHVMEESRADALYRALGVRVPDSTIHYDDDMVPYKVARFIEGGRLLNELEGDEKQAAFDRLKEDFASDALLANWDVIGKVMDNVIVDADGELWRIDNGGSLRYRATGGDKSESFKDIVNDLHTLRSTGWSATQVFGKMTWDDVIDSIEAKLPRLDDAAAVARAMELELGTIMKGRVANLREMVDLHRGDDLSEGSFLDGATMDMRERREMLDEYDGDDYRAELTDAQTGAISTYGQSGHKFWNMSMKVGTPHPHHAAEIKALQQAFDMRAARRNMMTYRGFHGNSMSYGGMLWHGDDGDVAVDPGATSTSLDPMAAATFGDGAMMRIRVPAGSKIALVSELGGNMSEDEILLQDGNVYRRLGKHSMRVGSAVYEVMDVELIGNQRKMDLREELTPATWLSEEMAEWFDLNEADSMSALPDLTDEQVIGASWSMVSGVRDLDDWRFIALQDELANRYDSVGLVHQEMSQLALNPDLDEDQQMMANRRRRHAGSVLAMIADARYLIGDTADRLRNKGRFANMTLTELVEAWYDAPSADSAMSRTAIRNELDNRGIEHHVSGGHLLATDEQRRAWEELSHLNGPELIEAFNQWYGMAEQPKLKSMFRKLLRAKIKIGEELGNYSDHLMRALRAALAKAEM